MRQNQKVIHTEVSPMVESNPISVALKREPFNDFIYLLYCKLRQKAESTNPLNRKISFSEASSVFGSFYRLPKELHFPFLKEMEKVGLVEIKAYHHILIKNDEAVSLRSSLTIPFNSVKKIVLR